MTDPVLARRARIARMVSVGQRVGYLLFAAAIVLFFVGFIARFTNALTSVILACLVIGSIVLAPEKSSIGLGPLPHTMPLMMVGKLLLTLRITGPIGALF
ncbi:MAG: hypothetical protein IH940_13685, partial [Acidobacteria bacterium]|nr:hypothetical protein [Acidobacteriota bacterium]